ncbi:MAG: paraquat-inducible protein A [Gammaproteobacteria bacterium]|nr:paraquat-inducible protein A [Gammaproteobacteria bacterium]
MKQGIQWTVLGLLFVLLCWSGWKSWEQASAYEQVTLEIIEALQAEDQLEASGQKLLEIISFGFYDDYSKKIEWLEQEKSLQSAYRQSVFITTGFYFFLALAILLLSWLLRRRLDDLGYAALSIAFVSLMVGLTTPILSLQASQELPILGETVFQFQSKGILTTISSLDEHGDRWLAALLLLFSVIIPMLKTVAAISTLLTPSHALTLRGMKLSHYLGKWSMADVFVVAILVAFFSSNSEGGITQAEVQAGLWFFAAYVVLSLVGTQLVSRPEHTNL